MTIASLALAAALSHARDGAWEPALASLLEAWRAQRAPEVAELIDLVSSEVTKGLPPLRGANRKTTRQHEWLAALETKRPALLERLLDAVPEVRSQAERLQLLLTLPPDPRLAGWAVRYIVQPRPGGPRERPFFDGLIAILERTMDPRQLSTLQSLGPEHARENRDWAVPERSWDALAAHRERLRAMVVAPLDAAAEATVATVRERILAVPEARDPAPLFDAVFADPTDDDARAVLGDLLLQRGDPRGELIALQLARAGTEKRRNPRETALVRTWGRDWRGPLAPALEDVVYERGFPSGGRWRGGIEAEKTVGAVAWSTIRDLDMDGYRVPWLLTSASMRSLRNVVGLRPEILFEVRDAGPLPWESVGLSSDRWTEIEQSLDSAVIAALPAVKRLVLARPYVPLRVQIPGLLALLARWPALEELELPIEGEDVAPLLADPASAHLERLVVREHSSTLTFDRRRKRITVSSSSAYGVAGVLEQVAPLRPSGILTTIDFRFTSRAIFFEPRVVALLLACGRETGIEVFAHGRPL